MNDAERYRQMTEECRQRAAKVFSPLDKEAWLRLAADWLLLVQMAEQREARGRRDE